MTEHRRAAAVEQTSERTPEQEATARAAGVWIHQFARTLKTCRLYDANNPTVIRFRAELGDALRALLAEQGSFRLKFTSDDVFCEDISLYPAKSRDDNLALPFYRDGVRALTFQPGAEREVDTIVDAVLGVTGQTETENDLVTTLWEAHLEHIFVDFVPAEGEVGGETGTAAGESLVPWPTPVPEELQAEGESTAAQVETVGTGAREDRSDDWTVGDLTVEIEAGFEELESLAPSEVERFQNEFRAEHRVPPLTASIAISQAMLATGPTPEDRLEVARFVPRLLRQSVAQGSWLEARASLAMMRQCASPEWTLDAFVQELLQPISVTNITEKVDAQDEHAPELVAFLGDLGEPGVDLLNLVLAESQNRKNRRLLAEAIAERCRENPERLAPWLSDPRWFVVRNIVHILGWVGGGQIVGMLHSASRHPDARVRQEVVAALGQVEPKLARPLLVRMLDTADSRLMLAVLHQLSVARDPGVARLLVQYLQAENFDDRSIEEKRAIYSTLAATADDAVLPDLDFELHKGNWFSKNQELHRQAVARCIARIGTPTARAILERGLTSRRPPVRKACEDALGGLTSHD